MYRPLLQEKRELQLWPEKGRDVGVATTNLCSVHFSSVQFNILFNTTFLEVVGLLEEMGFQSTLKLSFEDGGRAQLFQMTGAATLKLRLPSSVAILGTTR